ncbi:MAG: sugar phosphate isomerase/epimerase family protein [Anaerolineales bacterium]
MKIGFVSAILDGWNFEEVIDIAAEMEYQCVEVACWPAGKAERRYAGVSHIDVVDLSDEKAQAILAYAADRGVEISSLAFYPNPMDANLEKRQESLVHLKKVIAASAKMGINMVTTFIGRDQAKSVADNLKLFAEIWPAIIEYAESLGVKVAIENCPMLFGPDQWPGGQNLATTPVIWREMFKTIPSDYFGLNYDPSHFVWQMMDYLRPLYEFKDKIFHVHFKDIKLFPEKLNDYGIMAHPIDYMSPKLPGLGDVDWGKFVSALTDIGFDGYACIEVEDRSFEGSREKILDSLRISHKYMSQFVI